MCTEKDNEKLIEVLVKVAGAAFLSYQNRKKQGKRLLFPWLQ